MHFTLDYVERVELRDGSAVRLRLLAPEDKELLRRGFEALSAEARYARFLTPKHTLTDSELRYLTEIDHEHHFALGAIRETDGVGLGIARFIRMADDPKTAEAAIAVADEAQGLGLGRLLFARLVAAAAERGIAQFHCDLLGTNDAMVHLLRGIAPDLPIHPHEGVISVDLPLPGVSATEPATEPLPSTPMYRFFKLAAQNALEWTHAVRRFWLGD